MMLKCYLIQTARYHVDQLLTIFDNGLFELKSSLTAFECCKYVLLKTCHIPIVFGFFISFNRLSSGYLNL